LTSNQSTSFTASFARSSARRVAGITPSSCSVGSEPTTTRARKRARLQAVRLRGLAVGNEHGRGAVGDLARVRGGDHAVLAEHGLERRHLGRIDALADALVAGEFDRAARLVHARGREDLAVPAARKRPPGAGVALGREFVERGAGESPLLGDALGALALVDDLVLLEELGIQPAEAAVPAVRIDVREHAHARHVLHAAADRVARVARGDRLRGEVHGLLAGAAHAVERHRRYRHGKAGEQHAEAADVRALLARLGDGAADDVLDAFGGHARPCHETAQGVRK
jgi:hypothetical protein